ncbi:bifunctional diguanylate cyclase/phosphodiesterase [Methylomarinum vadi]|uniref:bifunctional diguanylate cyclase/phosphodiesterase n=1 Tax=Methylomarinum vadi TaxID=438855 RepID=UPI001362E421|nr:EAL domain-containing protein [Methylomarinum vadi]
MTLGLMFVRQNQPIITAQAQQQSAALQSVTLTAEEQAWLEAHQPIRIAFDGHFPPYSFVDQSGQLQGIAVETIQLISRQLNIRFEIDDRTLWTDIYPAALDKQIDVVATMVDRPERQFQFAFTKPYVFKSLVIVTHKNNQQIKDRSNLAGKTVALVKNYQYSLRILEEIPSITPFYADDMREALIAVENQQADAAIIFFASSYYLQNKYQFSQIKFPAFYDHNSSNESIAVRSDWPLLAGILQKGLDSLSLEEKKAINEKWYAPDELPIDYETIAKVVATLLLLLLILLVWIGQIKRQNRRITSTGRKLQRANSELNLLKQDLENQVLQRTKQLRNSEQKYRSLVENLEDEYFFYQHDLNGVFTYLSPSVTTILGYPVEQMLTHISTYLTDHPNNEKVEDYTARCLNGEKVPPYEVEILDSKGKKHCLEVLENQLLDDDGHCIGVEGIAHDITLLKQACDRLNWLSYYDDLTGLANRRLFTDRLEQMIALSHRQQETMALLFLDVDRFKMVNDSLGHAAGDEVLRETAGRLKSVLRESDMAARMGGDEFTLILPGSDTEAAKIVAEKLQQQLLAPYDLNGQQFILGTSIGIAIYPEDGIDAETLLQHADNAMYFAKKEKKGYAFCSVDMQDIANRRLLLEQGLRQALALQRYDDDFELQVYYQSKHCAQNHRLIGYEALMRWNHPDLGPISPLEFIPLAEESGLIAELSRWVINRVCRQAVSWFEAGIDFGKIAINISAIELINLELAKNIIQQIDAAEARREWIEIEITESALMKTPDVAIKAMEQLVNAGILIAIDDFGTGYSSLAYLKRLPASFIKIDQSFVRNVLHSAADQTVVHAVIAMSHALKKKVIAEGVETKEQLQYLIDNGCDAVQGFWFSKPTAPVDLFLHQGVKLALN